MSVNIIVARAKNNAIGKDNAIPWHIKEDLQHFKETTQGKKIVMGTNTYNSLPVVLKGREYIILTDCLDEKEVNEKVPGAKLFSSLDSLYDYVNKVSKDEEVFIVGGASIYRQFIADDMVDCMIISEVKKEYDGDCFFPSFEMSEWDSSILKDYDEFTVKKYTKRRK